MAKRRSPRTSATRHKSGTSARGPSLGALVGRHRIAVTEAVLQALQAVEPAAFAELAAERAAAKATPRDPLKRKKLAERLRRRRQMVKSVRTCLRPSRALMAALEDQFLPDHGVVGESCDSYGKSLYAAPLGTLQLHNRSKKALYAGWRSTVFQCAAMCKLAGSECIEPAILGCLRILHGLRELVDDDGAPTDDEQQVYDHRGRLRLTARAFLKALDEPRASLDDIAKLAKRDPAHVRRFSAPLQRLGLILMRTDTSWARTGAGTAALRAT